MGKKDKSQGIYKEPGSYIDPTRLVALEDDGDTMFEFPTGVAAPFEPLIKEIVRETTTVSAVHHREQEPGFLALQERDLDRQTRNLALAAALRLAEDRSFLTVRVKDGETDEEFAERKDSEHNARVNVIFSLADRVHAFLTLDENQDGKTDV